MPGETGFVRIWPGTVLPLLPGDRFVLREAGRAETVGGGEILDVDPIVAAARARPDRSVERVIHERGWVDAAELSRLTGVERRPSVGRWVVDPEVLEAARSRLGDAVLAAGREGLDVAGLGERDRALLHAGLAGTTLEGGRARAEGASSGELSEAAASVLAELEATPWAPPERTSDQRGALRELEKHGLAVEAPPVWFSTRATASAARVVAGLLAARPEGVTVADVRDALGTSRKHVLPLLAHLDARGITRRRGDVRVGGPRLPPVEG